MDELDKFAQYFHTVDYRTEAIWVIQFNIVIFAEISKIGIYSIENNRIFRKRLLVTVLYICVRTTVHNNVKGLNGIPQTACHLNDIHIQFVTCLTQSLNC